MEVRSGGPRDDSAGLGNPVSLLVTAEETQGRFALVETVVSRGEQPPMHSHTREDELVYVLPGR